MEQADISDDDNDGIRRRESINARNHRQRVVRLDEDDDDETGDEDDEEGSCEHDGFDEDMDIDDETEDEDEQEENLAYSRCEFVDTCLCLARNDATLVNLDEWFFAEEYPSSFQCQIPDLFLLGKSLCGNNHLKSLTVPMDPHDCVWHPPKAQELAADAVRQGMVQSKLHFLKLCEVGGMILSSFLEGCNQSSTLQRLEVHDTLICDLRPTTRLLDMTLSTPHAPAPSSSHSFVPLTHLAFSNCRLKDLDLLSIALSLANNTSLLALRLRTNLISDVGIMYLCQHWKDDSPLQELDLSWNNVGPAGVDVLLDTVQRHAAMHNLLLIGNDKIGYAGLTMIGTKLPQMRLQQLHFPGFCKIPVSPDSQQAARALAVGLRDNTSLVELNMGSINLGPEGAKLLMQSVAVHPTLEMLMLTSDKSIGAVGLQHIGNLLGQTKLKRLCLDCVAHPPPLFNRKMMRLAGRALLQGVKANGHLIDFSFFGLDSKWMKPIQFHVDWNRTARPLLSSEDGTPPALWPHVLARFQRQNKTSHLFFALREQPWLIICGRGGGTCSKPQK